MTPRQLIEAIVKEDLSHVPDSVIAEMNDILWKEVQDEINREIIRTIEMNVRVDDKESD